MKRLENKNLSYVYIFIIVISVIFNILLISLNNTKKEEIFILRGGLLELGDQLIGKIFEEKPYYQLEDFYGEENDGLPLSELLARPNIAVNFNNFYKDLNETFGDFYLPIHTNHVELYDYYNKSPELVNGGLAPHLANQNRTINGEDYYITPINAYEVGQNTFNYFNDEFAVSEGRTFEESDFNYIDNNINILLSPEFKNDYKIGDVIPFLLWNDSWNATVVGFLEDDKVLDFGFRIFPLHYRIIIPITDNPGYLEHKPGKLSEPDWFNPLNFYYMQKLCGSIYVDSTRDLRATKLLVEELAKNNDLEYTLLTPFLEYS